MAHFKTPEYCDLNHQPMQQYFRNEKRTITPEKAIKILAKHGTIITHDKAIIMLELLYKMSNLSVREAILTATAQKIEVLSKKKKVATKSQNL
ncbi:hypothetical protein [Mucilaginibacter sp.]|uniref:hypothetical protein n=1 Tax=Mucilaginibacter sp. TaxID=1882438 RepID=UPI0025F7A7C9|nr:hypothetical protein [Mucilaginibacter sp.]